MFKKALSIIIALVFLATYADAFNKKADLAGSWYSSDPEVLQKEIDGYLDSAKVGKIPGDILGVIAPHAGFIYSGEIAAYSYKPLLEKKPDLVVLVGFTHRKHFGGTSVFTGEAFSTPLGDLKIDQDLSKKLIASDRFLVAYREAFADENSIEMQIPFIQTALGGSRVVILAMGDQSLRGSDRLVNALTKVLQDEKSVALIASTDMCHYLPYDMANRRDAETIDLIKSFNQEKLYKASEESGHRLMCGFGATYVVMSVCKNLGADKAVILKHANSGDASGGKNRVVGYLSAAFIRSKNIEEKSIEKETSMFNRKQREELLKIARNTIRHYLETGKRLEVQTSDEDLKQDMGAFVTLHKNGQLRGCIGNMVARGPLYLAVRDMAIAAACEDPRFPSLRLEELDEVDIEISALSPMKKVDDPEKIEIGKHGVMVRRGWQSGVYLPQVADETGWSKEEFMDSLCAHKAGIPADSWKTGDCEIYIFTAEVFGEKDNE